MDGTRSGRRRISTVASKRMIPDRPASILFICDFDPGFSGSKHHTTGVGGTEAMVVVLSEALVARGVNVTVATRLDREECNGVRYQPVGTARPREADVTVLVKQWSRTAPAAGAVRVFLATDVHLPDPYMIARCLEWSTTSFALSPFMRTRLQEVTSAPAMAILSPPIALDDYISLADERQPVLLYCSVPDRGLYYLKDLFPAIRRRVANATLVITSDFSLWGRAAAKGAFLRFFERQPGVEYLGHVDRARLVAEQCRARVLAYPCTFEEGFCIAAAECMAAGTVPVTTNAFALTTTVGDAGVLIEGRPRSWLYRRRFVKAVTALLSDHDQWRARSRACRARAQGYGSATIAERFLSAVAGTGSIV
jgi:glycosyltransferase involved in cell wall biosynthesis